MTATFLNLFKGEPSLCQLETTGRLQLTQGVTCTIKSPTDCLTRAVHDPCLILLQELPLLLWPHCCQPKTAESSKQFAAAIVHINMTIWSQKPLSLVHNLIDEFAYSCYTCCKRNIECEVHCTRLDDKLNLLLRWWRRSTPLWSKLLREMKSSSTPSIARARWVWMSVVDLPKVGVSSMGKSPSSASSSEKSMLVLASLSTGLVRMFWSLPWLLQRICNTCTTSCAIRRSLIDPFTCKCPKKVTPFGYLSEPGRCVILNHSDLSNVVFELDQMHTWLICGRRRGDCCTQRDAASSILFIWSTSYTPSSRESTSISMLFSSNRGLACQRTRGLVILKPTLSIPETDICVYVHAIIFQIQSWMFLGKILILLYLVCF